MLEVFLTQAEADALIALEKHRVDDQRHSYPVLGGWLRIPLASPDGRESFFLDATRGRIGLTLVPMIDEVRKLLDTYSAWLKDRTKLRQVGDWVEITAPYLDRHSDTLQIYICREDGAFLLTDDGYTVTDLLQSGCNLESPRRKQLLKIILQGFGVQLRGEALQVSASPDNFCTRKHNLVQAMLAVNDMFYLANPMIASVFYEDVVAWMDLSDIRYSPRVKFTGKSGFDHLFHFVIPKSRSQPERILETINHPNRDKAEALAFSWIDTREVRPPESRAYAFLNDSERTVSSGVLDALRNYDVQAVLWSARDEFRQELAA